MSLRDLFGILRYGMIYSMDDFPAFYNYHMRPHNWTIHRWLGASRVWFERCPCGAIRFWRGNDTVCIEADGAVYILEHKEEWDMKFVRQVLREARENGLI